MIYALTRLCFVFAILTVLLLIAGIKIGSQNVLIRNLTKNIEWLENKKTEGGKKHQEMNQKIQDLSKRCDIQQKIINKLNARLGIKTPFEYKDKKGNYNAYQ